MSTSPRSTSGGAMGSPMTPGPVTPGHFIPFDDEPSSRGGNGVAGATTLFVLVVSILAMGMGADAQRVLLTATLALTIYAMINFAPTAGVPIALGYLAAVGAIKRYSLPLLGYAAYDPFLLVGPVVAIMMFIPRIARRDLPYDTPLSKGVLILLGIMFLEIFNPLQGGLTLGLTGAMFYIIPLLWFYMGRSIGTIQVADSLLRGVVFVAVAGASYGLYQQFFGFTDIELQWLVLSRNDSGLYLGNNVLRVFSFFSSFAEYVQFCIMGAAVALVYVLRKNRMMVVPFLFLSTAVFLSSSRGGVVGLLFSSCLIWAIVGKNPRIWIPRLVVAAVLGIVALTSGLQSVKTDSMDDTTSVLLEHQKRGLLAPLDKKQSTGGGHLRLILNGMIRSFQNPLGQGLGVTTIAAGKVGQQSEGSEFDVSDIFISCGLVGGCAYAFIIFMSIRTTAMMWHTERHLVLLCAFAVMAGNVGNWLMGARYASVMLVWFLIGTIDRLDMQRRAVQRQKQEEERLNQKNARVQAIRATRKGA